MGLAGLMRVGRYSILLLTLLLGMGGFSSGDARAAGFFLPVRGARALSHGGAVFASGDDLNAMWSNPATLFRSSAMVSVFVDFALINLGASFQRMDQAQVLAYDDRYAGGFPKVSSNAWFPDPSLAIGSNFGLKKFMFVLGVFGPYAGTTSWSDDDPVCGPGHSASACATQCFQDPGSCTWDLGPQRYSLIRPQRTMLSYQLSVSYRPIPEFSMGVGLFVSSFLMKERLKISTYPGIFGWAEDPTLDALIEIEGKDWARVGAVLGVWGRPLPWLELGMSFTTPIKVEAEGTLQVRLPSSYYFSDTTVQGNKIRIDTNFPMVLRVGARYVHPKELFDVELGVTWENWSVHRNIVVRPMENIQFDNVPGLGTYRVKTFTIKESFHDTVAVHVGGAVHVHKKILQVRAGYFFELGAVPDRTYTVQIIDGNKHGLGLGLSARFWKMRLDVTYGLILLANRTITDSQKRQVNPLYEEDTGPYVDGRPTIVGNGHHTAHYHILALTLSFSHGLL
jgi:long-chain fatty acid transport protein